MPPFADSTDPPPWQLPSSVLCGRLDQTRDWFATTSLALRIKDRIVLSAKDSAAADPPNPSPSPLTPNSQPPSPTPSSQDCDAAQPSYDEHERPAPIS